LQIHYLLVGRSCKRKEVFNYYWYGKLKLSLKYDKLKLSLLRVFCCFFQRVLPRWVFRILPGCLKTLITDAVGTAERSIVTSKCPECCRSYCVGVNGYSTAPPAHAAGFCQPGLPHRQDSRRSQRQKPLSCVICNKTCRYTEN